MLPGTLMVPLGKYHQGTLPRFGSLSWNSVVINPDLEGLGCEECPLETVLFRVIC